MDMTIIGIGLGILVVIFGVWFLVKKYNISTSEIISTLSKSEGALAGLKIILNSLGYSSVTIEKIYGILDDTFEKAKSFTTGTKDEQIEDAYEYALECCNVAGIAVNEANKIIVKDAITVGFNIGLEVIGKISKV